MKKIADHYHTFFKGFEKWTADIVRLMLRLVPAQVFISSGLSKWNGWFDFDEQKFDLFLYEFFCPDPPRPGALQLCDPQTLDYAEGSGVVTMIESLAVTAGVLEVMLPVMLIVGFCSRAAALGLMVMTLFIQLAVFPSWDHWWNPAVWWFATLLTIVCIGPGKISLDWWLKFERKK